ncbi:MAG: M23 family metallopeptidase [Deltaproteobacteria bacterium]|nr:M23 family metallopeptidase [Deltaproteobacteria bacterium]
MSAARTLALVIVGTLVAFWAAGATLPDPVCDRLPFANPDLADGWGSTCCGRTNPHRGVDSPQAAGTNIPAVADGTVVVKTSTGCLGNVVVVQHADGVCSGYAHMQTQSSLSLGDRVTRGQHVGRVGATGTCQSGAHLHLTLSRRRDGYFTGTTADPYAYIMDHLTCDRLPTGVVDVVGCDTVTGAALEPDDATAAIAARVSFGGPTGAAASVEREVVADVVRATDCAGASQPCAHGFVVAVPAALKDDVAHPVDAYGVDAAGRTALWTGAPQDRRCAPPALPVHVAGSARRLVGEDVLAAWGWSADDVVATRVAEVMALTAGEPLTAPIVVAHGDATFVRDGDVLRVVDDTAVLVAWGFDARPIEPMEDAMATALSRGAPWPAAPYLARGDDDAVFLIDVPRPLWAVVDAARGAAAWPTIVEAGAVVDAGIGLVNRGSVAWSSDVVWGPAAAGEARAFCDASWSSAVAVAGDVDVDGDDCAVAGRVAGPVAPGEATALALRLRAPMAPGPRQLCFALRQGRHAFVLDDADGGSGGAWCTTVLVVAPPPVGPPAGDDDAPDRGQAGPPSAAGAGCAATDAASLAPSWVALVALWHGARQRGRFAVLRRFG